MRNLPDGFKIENVFGPANIDYDPKTQHEDRRQPAEIVLQSNRVEELMTKPQMITEPTAEQCSANEQLLGRKTFACWYPQMGGYASKCIIILNENGECFDAHVWHDGKFPFNDGESPVVLHHCCAEQFIEFGQMVKGLQNG